MDFKQFVWGSGRLGRIGFSVFIVAMVVGLTVLSYLIPAHPSRGLQTGLIVFSCVLAWLFGNAVVARLHDADRTVWFAVPVVALVAASSILIEIDGVPPVGVGAAYALTFAVYAALAAIKGSAGANRFGPPTIG